jgi:hypothetical protein
MYRWFNRVTGISDQQTEPPITIEKDETLYCTPHGQVAELSSRTVFSFTSEKAKQLAQNRRSSDDMELRVAVSKKLRLPERQGVPEYRILRPIGGRRYPTRFATTYAVETEPGLLATVTRLYDESHVSRPPRESSEAILYVSHHSADAELRDEPLVKEVISGKPKTPFFACDVRGIGDSRPDTCGVDQFLKPYGNDYFYAAHSIMLDRPYVGQKTFDVLRVIDWLAHLGHTEIHLVAKGWGTLPAACAGLLAGQVKAVTLKQALRSFDAIAQSEEYDWPLSALLPDVLAEFDLPDVYRALETKKLRLIDPVGAISQS